MSSPFVRGLKCRMCGHAYPTSPINFCTEDFGPLEVAYDYDAIGRVTSREPSGCSRIGVPREAFRSRTPGAGRIPT